MTPIQNKSLERRVFWSVVFGAVCDVALALSPVALIAVPFFI